MQQMLTWYPIDKHQYIWSGFTIAMLGYLRKGWIPVTHWKFGVSWIKMGLKIVWWTVFKYTAELVTKPHDHTTKWKLQYCTTYPKLSKSSEFKPYNTVSTEGISYHRRTEKVQVEIPNVRNHLYWKTARGPYQNGHSSPPQELWTLPGADS